MFRVGQKVVCVDDAEDTLLKAPPPGFDWGPELNIVKGEIYTIEGIADHPWVGICCLTLVGVPKRYNHDFGYAARRFRPLITIQQDIALFHELCPGLPVVPPAVVPPRVPAPSHSD